jgi:hypothetical protein
MAGEQQQTPADLAADKSGGPSAFPSSGGSGAQTLAPLPFDESLVAALSAASSTQPTMTSSKSAADFFLDQIAAVVSDEKKLSDVGPFFSCWGYMLHFSLTFSALLLLEL